MFKAFLHDLNNIFTVLDGSITLLKTQRNSGEYDLNKIIKILEIQSEKAKQLANDFMSLSKGNGKYTTTVTQEYASQLWHFRESFNYQKKITFNIETKKNSIFKINPFDLDRIILNIVTNSIEAIKKNGAIKITFDVVKTINIYCNACNEKFTGEYGVCCIENSGEPIKNINEIFKKHYTTKTDGRGLGLYIVNFLLHLSDGHITVENINPGVCFKLYIPCKLI